MLTHGPTTKLLIHIGPESHLQRLYPGAQAQGLGICTWNILPRSLEHLGNTGLVCSFLVTGNR